MYARLLLAFMLLMLSGISMAEDGFKLRDTSGKVQRLSDYKGKWVLVNYWATWCPPCLEEVPDLVNLHDQRHKRDLAVIGVAWEYKNPGEVAHFVDDMLMSYPIVLGDAEVAAQIGPNTVLPTTYFYNPQGQLVKVKRGLVTRAFIESVVSGK
ncbi:TlpA disulfide reductase family protein [Methylovorus sp. MP688]|uniref:TlpA disulfide reductase family protein n=1 Tax=Methylovorus sp. (strain MP688) TaxID=887061 RepID=UPI0001EC488D|nr:TlpA disulfide reductase family protein [Methylovorus sp. MP688]ADQ85420.1 alkyl hydroperoxide reductase/ Thiol specific antioxidant/ Mal allergen [Methylovorus sp. MP688]